MKKKTYLWSALAILVLLVAAFLWFKYGDGIGADENPNVLVLPSGWSLVDGSELSHVDQNALVTANVVIYSYNDPDNAGNKWAIRGNGCVANESKVCVDTLSMDRKLSYFVYNKTNSPVSLNKQTGSPADKPLGHGWHTIAWKGQATTGNNLKNDLTITFATAGVKTLSAALDAQLTHSSVIAIDIAAPRP